MFDTTGTIIVNAPSPHRGVNDRLSRSSVVVTTSHISSYRGSYERLTPPHTFVGVAIRSRGNSLLGMTTELTLGQVVMMSTWHGDQMGFDFLKWLSVEAFKYCEDVDNSEYEIGQKWGVSPWRMSDLLCIGWDLLSNEYYDDGRHLAEYTALAYQQRKLYGREHHAKCPCRLVGYAGGTIPVPNQNY